MLLSHDYRRKTNYKIIKQYFEFDRRPGTQKYSVKIVKYQLNYIELLIHISVKEIKLLLLTLIFDDLIKPFTFEHEHCVPGN